MNEQLQNLKSMSFAPTAENDEYQPDSKKTSGINSATLMPKTFMSNYQAQIEA